MRPGQSALTLALVLLGAAPLSAQSRWEDRFFLDGGLSVPLAAREFDQTLRPTINGETGRIVVPHRINGGSLGIEVGAGLRIAGNFGAGATFVRWAAQEDATVAADVPSPVQFNHVRSATAVAAFKHVETALHVKALFLVPITPRFDLAFFAGPTWLRVTQDLATGIEAAEEAPFTTVKIANVKTAPSTVDRIGANAGMDATFFIKPLIGIGVTARYTYGVVPLPQADGTTIDADMRGFHVEVGIRLRIR